MEYLDGIPFTHLDKVKAAGGDPDDLARRGARTFLAMIFRDGLFHADPHPGNVLVTEDGRLALVDLGMVGRLSPALQNQMLKLLLAVSEGRGDDAADLAIKIGETAAEFDEGEFRRRVAELVTQQQNTTVTDMQIGKALLRFSRVTGDSGIRMPSELTMFGKALLNLDEIGRALDSEFDPNGAIRRHAAEVMRQRLLKSVTPGNIVASAMEAQEIISEMPRRVNRILDTLAKNEMTFRVEAIDEATLIEGFQKVANRITAGLVLGALIIGAAMLMRVETTFRLFGYPGFAMVCFLLAAGMGFWLVLSILLLDRPTPRSRD
jgi:predicted unusual protein kinase regulating ubiquinone biosynthesis (AarF/ABC1/UbiB family)